MHSNIIDNFCSIINQFDKNIIQLNTRMIFEKQKLIKNNNKILKNRITNTSNDINYKINSCNNYGCILENLSTKRRIDHTMFSITKECLDIRFDFYNKLSNMRFDIKPNLTNSQINDIKWFVINKLIKILV
jgi:hypothetical protein